MGCGQSKIHLYPRKSKSKANGKKGGHVDSDAETDEDEGHIEDSGKCQNATREKNEESEEQSNRDTNEGDAEVAQALLQAKNLSLLQSQEISSSQQNFFRMLDRKIQEGPDYDSASETEMALEEARLNALVQHWESASLTASICSSASRSLQTTPVRQTPAVSSAVTAATTLKPLGATMAILQPAPQQLSDFLPHGGTPQTAQLQQLTAVKHPHNQQIVISHMNTKLFHQMGTVPQMPINIPPEVSATTANTSNNTLAMLQASNQPQQFTHILALPTSSQQTNISPKRIMDARLLMSASPMAKQTQSSTQMQNQFIHPSNISPASSSFVNGGAGGPPLQMTYFGQSTVGPQNAQISTAQQDTQQQSPPNQSQPYYDDVMQTGQTQLEYRFPPAISVHRLAPQVQRQLRETQELIKDSCPQLYAAGYGSPGPPIRSQARNPTRRPTLETQFSQELS